MLERWVLFVCEVGCGLMLFHRDFVALLTWMAIEW